MAIDHSVPKSAQEWICFASYDPHRVLHNRWCTLFMSWS